MRSQIKMINNKPLRRLNEKWPWKVKVTVVDNKLYPESAYEYCDYPNLGKCSHYNIGDVFIFERDKMVDQFESKGFNTLIKTTADLKVKPCLVAWNVLERYIYAGLTYTGLMGKTIIKGWRENEEKRVVCCSNGARTVVFKIEIIGNSRPFKAWITDFVNWEENAFKNYGSEQRLLGNLLVLTKYINTLRLGLAERGKTLLPSIERVLTLLWNCLEGNTELTDLENFANNLYNCYYIMSSEDWDELDALFESHQSLYMEYFGNDRPCFYEWLAVEWVAGLLMQVVSIAGGRLDFDEFDCCEYVDLYGVYLLMDRLENIAAVGVIPPLQEITQSVQSDLRRARSAKPEVFASLQKEYLEYTIVPKEYAEKLLDY